MAGRRQHRASRRSRRWPPRWPTPAGRRTRLAARWQGPDPLPTTRRRNGRCPHHASTRAPDQPTFGCFSLSAHGNQWYPMPGRRQGARKTSMELPHAPTRRPIRSQPEKPSLHAPIDRGATVKCAVRACWPPTQQPIGMLQTLAEGWSACRRSSRRRAVRVPTGKRAPQAFVSQTKPASPFRKQIPAGARLQADPCERLTAAPPREPRAGACPAARTNASPFRPSREARLTVMATEWQG